jgi:hypothetical protein
LVEHPVEAPGLEACEVEGYPVEAQLPEMIHDEIPAVKEEREIGGGCLDAGDFAVMAAAEFPQPE